MLKQKECSFCKQYPKFVQNRQAKMKSKWDFRTFQMFDNGEFRELSQDHVYLRLTRKVDVPEDSTAWVNFNLSAGASYYAHPLMWKGKEIMHVSARGECMLLEPSEFRVHEQKGYQTEGVDA